MLEQVSPVEDHIVVTEIYQMFLEDLVSRYLVLPRALWMIVMLEKTNLAVRFSAAFGRNFIMSRIGKLPVEIPSGVNISLESNAVSVKGPKGELSQGISPCIRKY